MPHLDSGTDWAATAESYRQRIEHRLETTVLPGLGAHIVTSRVTTPQDFHDRLLSYKGAAFGLEPLLSQSAYFRPHNRSEDVAGLLHGRREHAPRCRRARRADVGQGARNGGSRCQVRA